LSAVRTLYSCDGGSAVDLPFEIALPSPAEHARPQGELIVQGLAVVGQLLQKRADASTAIDGLDLDLAGGPRVDRIARAALRAVRVAAARCTPSLLRRARPRRGG